MLFRSAQVYILMPRGHEHFTMKRSVVLGRQHGRDVGRHPLAPLQSCRFQLLRDSLPESHLGHCPSLEVRALMHPLQGAQDALWDLRRLVQGCISRGTDAAAFQCCRMCCSGVRLRGHSDASPLHLPVGGTDRA